LQAFLFASVSFAKSGPSLSSCLSLVKSFFPLLKIASTTFSLGLAEIESFPSRSQGLFNFSLEKIGGKFGLMQA